MRKNLIIAVMFLFIASLGVYSQQKVKFLNIEWGISPESLAKELKGKGYVEFGDPYDEYKIRYSYQYSGIFSGRDAVIVCKFYENKFCETLVMFKKEENRFDDFKSIASGLRSKYGKETGKIDNDYLVWNYGNNGSISLLLGDYLILFYSDEIISSIAYQKVEEMENKEEAKKNLDL